MLIGIRTVTYCVSDLTVSRAAITNCFGYNVTNNDRLAPEIAHAWQAPHAANSRCCYLQPSSGEPFFIRLVEFDTNAEIAPLRTYGWNAAELLVKNVDTLSAQLEHGQSFQIIGGPRDLMENGSAIALQVLGPGRELFYLTEINGKQMQKTYGAATCSVDRLFIVVLGAEDHQKTRDFYESLGTPTTRTRNFSIKVLANAHDLDPDRTEFGISSACLQKQFRIEIDDYPSSAHQRVTAPGDLPAGLAMVSFTVSSLTDIPNPGPIIEMPNAFPYYGCNAMMIRGPNDEWLELLEGT